MSTAICFRKHLFLKLKLKQLVEIQYVQNNYIVANLLLNSYIYEAYNRSVGPDYQNALLTSNVLLSTMNENIFKDSIGGL